MTAVPGPPSGTRVDLDGPEIVARFERDGMLQDIRSLPQQCALGWDSGTSVRLPPGYANPTSIVIAGIGGSAMGGDVVRGVTLGTCKVPIVVNRDYVLPSFVSADTLVVCSSYSGGTEETLSAFEHAVRMRARIVAMGRGGKLFEVGAGCPQIRLLTDGMPRAALVESVHGLLGLLQQLAVVPSMDDAITELPARLERSISEVDFGVAESENQAKTLARAIHGKMPVVIGVGHLGPVARRWKAQINENSDQMAFCDELPEFNHNSIQGLSLPRIASESLHAVFLHPDDPEDKAARQGEIAASLLEGAGIETTVLKILGEDPLSQALNAVVLGDFVSLYLAGVNGVDPTPIENIAALKSQMARG